MPQPERGTKLSMHQLLGFVFQVLHRQHLIYKCDCAPFTLVHLPRTGNNKSVCDSIYFNGCAEFKANFMRWIKFCIIHTLKCILVLFAYFFFSLFFRLVFHFFPFSFFFAWISSPATPTTIMGSTATTNGCVDCFVSRLQCHWRLVVY